MPEGNRLPTVGFWNVISYFHPHKWCEVLSSTTAFNSIVIRHTRYWSIDNAYHSESGKFENNQAAICV